MHLRNRLKIISFLCFILLVAGCAPEPSPQDILKAMVKLDRAYIPAILFANLQKPRESEIAMERFRREWNKFNRKYSRLEIKYGKDIMDKYWKEDFAVIQSLVASAEEMVKAGELSEAQDRLEAVQMVLRELRHRNALDYYLESMHEFRAAMETIILSLRGKDRLMDRDLDHLRRYFKKAQAGWAKIAKSDPDPCLFGLKPEKVEAIRKRVKEEEQALASFAAALSSQDADRIFQAAQDLKPNFVVLYKAFGDFQPVFDQVVRERKRREKNEAGVK